MYMPTRHRAFLERALAAAPAVDGIVGLAAGGSFIAGEMDEFSDLDLVLAVEPGAWPEILERQQAVAAELDPSFLAGFTGEHVGEPRLLVCLYGPPLLHVDLKFVSLDDAHERIEDPVILWEVDGCLTAAFARAAPRYPHADPDWIEDRLPAFATDLERTVEGVDAAACAAALEAAIELYTELRETTAAGRDVEASPIEREVRAYVAGLPARLRLPGRDA